MSQGSGTPCRHGFAPQLYLQLRAHLLQHDTDAQALVTWSLVGCKMPETPEDLAREVVWIILCAGRSAQAARTLEARVWKALHAGRPAVEAFGYRAKAAAIDRAWREREADFLRLKAVAATGDPQAVLDWCGSLPFVGAVTRYQLAKNVGVQTCKPDRWLSRCCGIADEARIAPAERFARCQQLALELSAASGDPVPVVDSLLYLAGNKGLLQVRFDPHEVRLQDSTRAARSIYLAAPPQLTPSRTS